MKHKYIAFSLTCFGLIVLAMPAGAQQSARPRPRRMHPVAASPQAVADVAAEAAASAAAAQTPSGTWQPLTNQPPIPEIVDGDSNDYGPGGGAAPLLLTDGSVLVQDFGLYGEDARVFKLTPDLHGSYVNGTWTELAPKPDVSADGAQAVLSDGRVILEGGEYSGYPYYFTLTNQGAIYDPVANSWTSVDPPPFFVDLYPPRASFAPNPIGDSASIVLANGTFMLEDKMSRQAALLNLNTMTWTETGTSTKADLNDEEGLTLLPDGEVLTVDCYTDYNFGLTPSYPSSPTHSEIYNPLTGHWSSAGSTIQSLTDPELYEIGPAMLRPNGTVFALGSSGNSSIYNTLFRRWSLGPTLPISHEGNQFTAQDAPGVLLPSGNVLIAASGGAPNPNDSGYSDPPVGFFEFDGTKFIAEPTIPNAANDMAGSVSLLLLPTGQVMAVDSTNDVEIYTPGGVGPESWLGTGAPNALWRPLILAVPLSLHPGSSYQAFGIRFNGMSQACAFGDELQCATNYPLVRMTNLRTGHVFYSRTHNHSSMAVASPWIVSTHFDVPAVQETGLSALVVVANGIPSAPVIVNVH